MFNYSNKSKRLNLKINLKTNNESQIKEINESFPNSIDNEKEETDEKLKEFNQNKIQFLSNIGINQILNEEDKDCFYERRNIFKWTKIFYEKHVERNKNFDKNKKLSIELLEDFYDKIRINNKGKSFICYIVNLCINEDFYLQKYIVQDFFGQTAVLILELKDSDDPEVPLLNVSVNSFICIGNFKYLCSYDIDYLNSCLVLMVEKNEVLIINI